jgi:ABC-type nickel/cobalt efflux system permease component RcnA
MKNIGIDIIFPWEIGLALFVIGLLLVILGVRQSKKQIEDFDKVPLFKPTTKILFGSFMMIFGAIQLMQLL